MQLLTHPKEISFVSDHHLIEILCDVYRFPSDPANQSKPTQQHPQRNEIFWNVFRSIRFSNPLPTNVSKDPKSSVPTGTVTQQIMARMKNKPTRLLQILLLVVVPTTVAFVPSSSLSLLSSSECFTSHSQQHTLWMANKGKDEKTPFWRKTFAVTKPSTSDDWTPSVSRTISITKKKKQELEKFKTQQEKQKDPEMIISPNKIDFEDIMDKLKSSFRSIAQTLSSDKNDSDGGKFDVAQRLESVKCAVLGALSGGIAVTPVAYVHYANNLAQWEFTTDMASLQAALFAIVYRYAIRKDTNPMLNQGVVGAFVFARTLSSIRVSEDCSFAPLSCEFHKTTVCSIPFVPLHPTLFFCVRVSCVLRTCVVRRSTFGILQLGHDRAGYLSGCGKCGIVWSCFPGHGFCTQKGLDIQIRINNDSSEQRTKVMLSVLFFNCT